MFCDRMRPRWRTPPSPTPCGALCCLTRSHCEVASATPRTPAQHLLPITRYIAQSTWRAAESFQRAHVGGSRWMSSERRCVAAVSQVTAAPRHRACSRSRASTSRTLALLAGAPRAGLAMILPEVAGPGPKPRGMHAPKGRSLCAAALPIQRACSQALAHDSGEQASRPQSAGQGC